jgi:hypothetical protein
MAKTRGWGGSDRYRFALFSAPYSSFEGVSFSGCTIVLFGAGTQPARNGNVSDPVECQLIGRWRIVEADLWDRAYLDLAGPAYLEIADKGWAEFAFGAIEATAELEYGRTIVFFR